MADAHLAEIKAVIKSLQEHNVRVQEMLAIPTDKFALNEMLTSQAILAVSKELPDVAPNADVAKGMEKPQLAKLIDLVGQVVALEDAVRVAETALKVKLKAFAKRYGVGGTPAE